MSYNPASHKVKRADKEEALARIDLIIRDCVNWEDWDTRDEHNWWALETLANRVKEFIKGVSDE
tara:strand:+ start:296 stop:487 length:192 start_codon:yes stop_codon:yes gene_type:complete